MAFSSEVRFKIGADTSALSKGFVAAQSMAATAGQQIQKKFTGKNLFQGLLQGIGIGSVDAVADLVVRPFQLGYERAKDILGLTSRLRDITNAEVTAGAGRAVVIRETQKEIYSLNREIEIQQQLVTDLNANPINFVSPQGLALMRDAETELTNLKVRQAELNSKITTDAKTLRREQAAWLRQELLASDLSEAELRNAGEREKLAIRLNALQEEFIRLKKAGDIGTAREGANQTAQFDVQRRMALLDKQAREERAATLSGLGQSLATGQMPARAPRGRSEAERIADRGAANLARAEEAIRTGRSPDFVGQLTARANRDFTAAGERARAATTSVAKSDSAALSGELIKANDTLKKIEANLAPTAIQ